MLLRIRAEVRAYVDCNIGIQHFTFNNITALLPQLCIVVIPTRGRRDRS